MSLIIEIANIAQFIFVFELLIIEKINRKLYFDIIRVLNNGKELI